MELEPYFAALAVAVALSAIVSVMRWLPEWLDAGTFRWAGTEGVPQRGRYILIAFTVVIGLSAVAASAFAPFPALYGPALVLTAPLWARTEKRNLTQFVAPVQIGLEQSGTCLYILGAIATLIGVLRLGP